MLGRMAAKRLLDVVCATLLMLFLAPVLIVVVAAMTLSMLVARQVAEGLTYRNEVRAGLTGPAQVTKGSGLRFADLDLRYVDSLRRLGGLALVRYDLQILWATVRVIARGEGLSY